MAQPFFASTAGDPASLIRMLAFQTAESVPCLDAALVPYKSYGGILSPSPTSIRRQSILTRPMRELPFARFRGVFVAGGPSMSRNC